MSKTLVSHTEQIGHECTDETSFRLPSRSHKNELHREPGEEPDGVCKQYSSHVTFFSFTARTCSDVWYHIGSCVGARHPIHLSCAWVIVGSLFSTHLILFRVFLYLPLLLPEPWLLPFFFYGGRFGVKPPVRFREWGVWSFGQQHSSHRLWGQDLRRLPLLRDHWNFHPGVLHRHQALVFAWLGDQWRHHRQSALFTIVHSRARWTSWPLTSLSLSWRKFVVKSVVVCGSLRWSVTENPCRNSKKWANQDSLGTTKKANYLHCRAEIQNTNSKPIMTEVSRNWMELSSLSEEKLIMLLREMNNFDEINNFFTNSYASKIGIFVKLMWKVSMRWYNWSDFQGSTFATDLRE